MDGFHRLYAFVELERSDVGFIVKVVKGVPYQTVSCQPFLMTINPLLICRSQTSQPGPPVHPRIHPVSEGAMVSIQFGDAVALCARGQALAICFIASYLLLYSIGSDYQDRLELKSNNNRTLGIGIISSTSTLLILTATTMMKIRLDLDIIQGFKTE